MVKGFWMISFSESAPWARMLKVALVSKSKGSLAVSVPLVAREKRWLWVEPVPPTKLST